MSCSTHGDCTIYIVFIVEIPSTPPFVFYILCKHLFHYHLLGRKSAQQGLEASRLPVFTTKEKSYIRGTCDFLGIGHFTTRYITQKNNPSGRGNSYFTDRDLAELVDPRWPDPGSEWLYSVPWGFRRLLNFVKVNKIYEGI